MGKRFQMTGFARANFADALGNSGDLAALIGKKL
jgi:hypothetical protein